MYFSIIFFLSLLLTAVVTPLLIRYSGNKIFLDLTESRNSDSRSVPRLGGVIIYFTTILCILIFYGHFSEIQYFTAASLLLLAAGIIDDIIEIGYKEKFAAQIISALFLIAFLSPSYRSISFSGLIIPQPFDKIILLFFIVGVINAVNFYDGLDGLAAGFSTGIFFFTFIMGQQLNSGLLLVLSASLIGSLIGFLKYNSDPARIFLGDSGSLTLGFFIVTSALLLSINKGVQNLDLSFAVILLGVPVVDALKVVFVRLYNRKNPFLADLSHIHHIILITTGSKRLTLIILHGFSLLFMAAAGVYSENSVTAGIIIFVSITFTILAVRKLLSFSGRFTYTGNFIKREPSYLRLRTVRKELSLTKE